MTVFAAGSTLNAVSDIAELFRQQKKGNVATSFAASSTLAKQIDNGAPAHVFLCANKKWMDYLEERMMIDKTTRVDLLSNRIVLVAPTGGVITRVDIKPNFPLAGILADGRLAMGDPDHVPAGIYGKKALESLGVWNSVGSKVARAKDVRAALALVERGEAPLGVVYATDAAVSKKVTVVGVFPGDSHPFIVYPAALVGKRRCDMAARFLQFLQSDEARQIFEQYGFTVR